MVFVCVKLRSNNALNTDQKSNSIPSSWGKFSLAKVGLAKVGLAGLVMAAFVATTSEAEARKRYRGGYTPPYASLVVDAKTGRILQSTNEDALRYPASITKVMTLYMVFEQLERGRLSLHTPLRVSGNAASQAPSKIGFDAGDTISVENAIKALVTKSANDVAVTIAENLGGSEEAFADQMTRKARSIGMKRTTFRNASGLPDSEQVTTARDLVTLARALQDNFPQYYHYFGTRSFEFAGSSYRNHNKLLGRVEGVDGIKTGYTRLSGFNLLTSARSEDRHVIGVVLGGKSGRARDQVMASLIESQLPRAYAGARTAPRFADNASERPRPAVIAAGPRNSDSAMDMTPVQPTTTASLMRAEPRVAPPSRPEPLREERVAQAIQSEVKKEVRTEAKPLDLQAARPVSANLSTASLSTATPSSMRWTTGAQPVVKTTALAGPLPPMPVTQAPIVPPSRIAMAHATSSSANTAKTELSSKGAARSSWLIQLGATDEEGKAKDILARAKSQSQRTLAQAEGFTEKVQKDGTTLFRARFGGFDEADDAQAACKALKRSGFSCFATRS
jgi:D-alanyl-D-alanine carboxypeptidase